MSTLPSRIVLFADTRSSTKLYVDLGNDAAAAAIGQSMAQAEGLIGRAGGFVVKRLGDGLMAAFHHAGAALSSAIAIQRLHTDGLVHLGIGIQGGEVVERDGDIFGDAANVASRLCSLARPDEILVGSDAVALLPRGEFTLESIDKFIVKGKDHPIDVFRVVWDAFLEQTSFVPSIGPVKTTPHLRISAQGSEFVVGSNCPRLTIGRQDCDLLIVDPVVSRRHAIISWSGGRFILTDQSTNGTTIRYAGGQESFIRREDTDIVGAGVIALGPASIPNAPCVLFECF